MKRNIVYAFMLTLALMLSGCGSNSKSDRSLSDLDGVKVFEAEAGSLTVDTSLNFSTSIPFKKLEGSDVTIEFSNFNLALTGCELDGPVTYSPSPLVLDGSKDSQKSMTISGKVKNNCAATGYVLSADKKITLEGQSETTKGINVLSTTLDANGNPGVTINPNNPTVDGNFSFTSIPLPITISKISEKYEFKLRLIDKNTDGVSGKTIKISTYNNPSNRYGEIKEHTVVTDSNGDANFLYTSPDNLTQIDGEKLELKAIFDDNGTKISAIITLLFNASSTTSDIYDMQVIPTDSNITVGAEAKPINVYVKDSAGRPAENIEVEVEFFDKKFGDMNTFSGRTDSNGRIEFVFIAPKDIEPLDEQTFNFDVSLKDSPAIKQTVQIGFKKSVEVSRVSDIYIAPNDITIVRAGETRTIRITTVDSRNYAVSTNLKIENPAQNGIDYGTFDASDFTTDNFGNKEIVYTAPTELSGLIERNITVVELSTGIEKILTIHYQQPASQSKSYTLNLSVNDSISVDGTGTLGILIHESGKPNDYISNADVINVTATMKFPKMLKFDNAATTVNYATKNINSFALHAEHLSGVAIIEVEATVFDGVNNTTLKQEFPVVITSGAISSISMFHASSSFDASKGVYQDLYTLHAVDKYGNPVNEGTALHPTLINGIKSEGTLGDIATGAPSVFTDTAADFSSVVDTNQSAGDRLIVIPAAGTTSKFYLGDWSIKSHTATSLTLEEQYDDVNTNGLTYAVGNENRVLVINGKSKTAIADISSPDDNFKTDTQGNMQFVVSYDPDLKGKTFYLAANGPSGEKRIGTALKSSFFYGGYQLRVLINDVTFSSPGSSFSTGFYVLDSVGNTYDGQFNVTFPTDLDPAKYSNASIDNTSDTFVFTAPTDPNEFNALVGTTYEFNLTISETDETFQTIRVHYALDVNYTNYQITSAESNFTISTPNQEYTLEYFVSDGTKAVVDEEVRVAFIDPLQGSLANYTARTDSSGRATFTYIAPSDLSLLFANPLTINAFLSNQSSINTNVTALFVANGALYKFINESNLTIEHADDQIDIKAQLLLEGVPVEGKTVQMEGFDAKYGSVFNYTVVTDAGGYATFAYTAPNAENFDEVNGTTQTFKIKLIENGKIIEETNATISFNKVDIPPFNPNNELNITLFDKVNFDPLELVDNAASATVKIQVFKDQAPYTQGIVKVKLPDEAISGLDVGLFKEYNASLDSRGIATFEYTGPSNLTQTIFNDEDNKSVFEFYHVDEAENTVQLTVKYNMPIDDTIIRNYAIDIITGGDFSMGLPFKKKSFSVVLTAKDSSGNDIVLDDENITKITVSSENTQIAQLLDGNITTDSLVLATNSFTLLSKKLSGLVPIKVFMEFKDVNGEDQNLSKIVNVRVLSGPASAISISYVSTEQDAARAKYIETLAISVTDEYGNKVNTRPNISVGAIAGYAVDGGELNGNETNETQRLFYGRSSITEGNASGEIKALDDNNTATTNFEDNTPARQNVFKYVNAEGNNTDKLVVFGERKNYEAMGKWDIEKGGDDHTLSLKDNYLGVDRTGLYYAVGHNYYQDQCRDDGREWIGTTDSNTYKLDEEGTVTVTYKYDYHLTGKDALIWVNLDGIQPDTDEKTRVGEATKHTLRGRGLRQVPSEGYTLAKGVANQTVSFGIWHQNAPEPYRNGHFAWRIKGGSTCAIVLGSIYSSNQFDARTCINGGQAFVQMTLSNPDPDKDCSFNIEGLVVSDEF